MTIEFSLSDESLDAAINQLESYIKDFKSKPREIVNQLALKVENSAREQLTEHVWNGETIASLHTERGKDKKDEVSSSVVVGGAAIWLEFGTGVVANNCATGEYVHPKAQELGMYGIGEYGHGWGSNPNGWYFYDAEWTGTAQDPERTLNVYGSHRTFGIPATRFMYYSAWAGRRDVYSIAKGVFRT